MLRKSLLGLCVILPLFLGSGARAQPKTQKDTAATLFAVAEVFFKAEEYQRALDAYLESYKLSNYPDLLFNMGQCYRFLNRPEDALRSYQGYLAAVPGSPLRKDVEAWIKELEPLVAKAKQAEANQPVTPPPTSIAAEPATAPVVVQAPVVATSKPSPLRFVLPGGLAVGGLAFAAGTLHIQTQIQKNHEISDALYRQRLGLAVAADISFIGAGVSLVMALKKREAAVAVSPMAGGAALSLSLMEKTP